jgi:RNA polymerase sigma-70 factor, ECF subfamily
MSDTAADHRSRSQRMSAAGSGDGEAKGTDVADLKGRIEDGNHRPANGAESTAGPAADSTDEALLTAYLHGDKQAFATLVKRYERELYLFLVRFLGDRAAADDVFQEAFLQVHQSIEQFDASKRFRPWLFTIAANKARDLLRSNARRPTSPLEASITPGDDDSGKYIDLMRSAAELPDEPLQRRELSQRVQKTVAQMPGHLKEILLLSYFHGFAYKQIGDILDIPLGTVKSRLHAAVAFFAEKWRESNRDRSAS